MNDRQVSPPGSQILGDQAAMAAVRFRLAAQKDRGPVQQIAAEGRNREAKAYHLSTAPATSPV